MTSVAQLSEKNSDVTVLTRLCCLLTVNCWMQQSSNKKNKGEKEQKKNQQSVWSLKKELQVTNNDAVSGRWSDFTPNHFIWNKHFQLWNRCIPSSPAKVKHVFQLELSRKSLSVSSTWSTSCAPPSEVTDYVLKNRKCMIELFAGLSWASLYLWPPGWLVQIVDFCNNTNRWKFSNYSSVTWRRVFDFLDEEG